MSMIFTLNFRPVLIICIPLIAAILIYFIGEHVHRNIRESITIFATLVTFCLTISMIPAVLSDKHIEFSLLPIIKDVSLAFNADSAAMVFACVSSLLWIFTSIYSIGYMRGHHESNQTGFFASFALAITGTLGLCFAANLITFFLFFEILTIATYPLVVHYRDAEGVFSGRKYLIYTLISGQLFLAGIIIVYVSTGTMDFCPGGFIDKSSLGQGSLLIVFFLMCLAGLVKSGVMPLHSWLPAAMVAPTPVSALLHAVAVVNAGAFATLRIVLYVFGPDLSKASLGSTILSWMAVATILISSLIAIRKDNLKARLAYSTVGQLSYIILGICILTPFSMQGALYHMVAHSFMKILLFMCAGAIYVTLGIKNISDMQGVGKTMPFTMAGFTIASVALAGFPFFAGFISKANIILGAIQMGKPIFVATLIVSALLALTYLMPVILIAFKKSNSQSVDGIQEANLCMLIPIVLISIIVIVLGIYPNAVFRLFDLAAQAAVTVFETLGTGL